MPALETTAKLFIAIPISLITACAALWIWSAKQGRLFQSSKSCLLTIINILITAAVSTAAGVFILEKYAPWMVVTAGLPFTLLGSKTKVDATSTADGGKKNAFSELLTGVLDIASMLLAPFLAKLKDRLRKDRNAWAQTVDGEHKCYLNWTWPKLRVRAERLYDDLRLLIDEDEDPTRLGKLDAYFEQTAINRSLPSGSAEYKKALRQARAAFIDMRCLAYIWGHEEHKPLNAHASWLRRLGLL